jgi:hypothetical protein
MSITPTSLSASARVIFTQATAPDPLEACPVCFEPLKDQVLNEGYQVLAHDGWHHLHKKCHDTWVKQVPKCPTCKRDIALPLKERVIRYVKSINVDHCISNGFERCVPSIFALPGGFIGTGLAAFPHIFMQENRESFAIPERCFAGFALGILTGAVGSSRLGDHRNTGSFAMGILAAYSFTYLAFSWGEN